MQDDITVRRLFAVPLLEVNGIFHSDCTSVGLSDEFLCEAETYDERYFDSDYLRGRLSDAFSQFNLGPAPVVLDLGAGSGASVMATLELRPQARVVATDLSQQLLGILRRRLAQRGLADRCWLVKADISRAGSVRERSFDLIVGNAILHHLLRPDRLLREVCRWLRPGGRAVFFEPFASGQFCFALLCERLAVDSKRLGLPSDVVSLLERFVHDIRVRLSGIVPYEHLEDKWLFTRSYLETALAGVGEVLVTPAEPSSAALERQLKGLMKHGLGLDEIPASHAVCETLRLWDAAFGPLFHELILYGRIIVRPIPDFESNLKCSVPKLAQKAEAGAEETKVADS